MFDHDYPGIRPKRHEQARNSSLLTDALLLAAALAVGLVLGKLLIILRVLG